MGETIDIRRLLEVAAVNLGMTPDQLLQLVQSGKLTELLTPQQQGQLMGLLQHPEKAEQFLSDPEVKDAVRKWQHGK